MPGRCRRKLMPSIYPGQSLAPVGPQGPPNAASPGPSVTRKTEPKTKKVHSSWDWARQLSDLLQSKLSGQHPGFLANQHDQARPFPSTEPPSPSKNPGNHHPVPAITRALLHPTAQIFVETGQKQPRGEISTSSTPSEPSEEVSGGTRAAQRGGYASRHL